MEAVKDYLANGFKSVWAVYRSMVMIYRADGTTSRLYEHGEITGEDALPEFKCKVGEFFK